MAITRKDYTVNSKTIHTVTDNISNLRLLNCSYAKLSTIRSREGDVAAITNCSYFLAGQYVLGRNQGDDNNDKPDDYLSVVVLNDGSYASGVMQSWDYTENVVAGFTPATLIYQDGKLVKMFESKLDYSSYDAKMKLATACTLFGILSDKTTAMLITAEKGISGNDVVSYLTGTAGYTFDLLCALDGGGSTEMIVEGTRVQTSTDGTTGRTMYNGLAFISKTEQEEEDTSEEVVDTTKLPFLQRLSWDGMTDNYIVSSTTPITTGSKYWYDSTYNSFTSARLALPNCTSYVGGRAAEIAQAAIKSEVPTGNAKTWWTASSWSKGSTPKVGAIAVWGGTNVKYGHVAVVEQVNDDGTVTYSQSNYTRSSAAKMNSNYFQVKTKTLEQGKVTSGMSSTFLGYLYNPYVNDIRVSKDTSKSQVEVLVQKIKARKNYGLGAETHAGLYIAPGRYNILETAEADGYT